MGQHWYDTDGNPQHFLGKDGSATTLRQARVRAKEGNPIYPSVTTIGNIVSKFQLQQWLMEEAAMMAASMALGTSGVLACDRAWAKTVVAASRDKTMAKADAGTKIHDILEKHIKREFVPIEHKPMCTAVEELIIEKAGIETWMDAKSEARFCDVEHGFAGMADLHTDNWIIDFKTKDEVDAKTRGWPEQAEQLAAYAHGLGYPNARLANVFISR
ncbi:unnamed protein product, partial [marine sediment metagenome]